MEIVLLVGVGAIVMGALLWMVARTRASSSSLTGPAPRSGETRSGGKVVLDIEVDDRDQPSVRRLVQGAAGRALQDDPALDRVEIVDRRGTRLAVVARTAPRRRPVALPASLHEPHLQRSRAPDPIRSQRRPDRGTPGARPGTSGAETPHPVPPGLPFAHRFDLSHEVRESLTDPDSPASVVAALLAASGRPVERHGDLILSGDVAVAVAPVDDSATEALTRAFLRVRDSGAPRGIVIRLGYADLAEIRRREAAAPHVRHAGIEAIQRMADAVALGADPLSFVVVPGVAR